LEAEGAPTREVLTDKTSELIGLMRAELGL
jgi:hypothetical protein